MQISRRQLVKSLGALSALGLGGGWLPAAQAGRLIPWRNWSGSQVCIPAQRLSANSEAELAALVRNSPAPIRPVGSGHSFSALVPTEGTLLSTSGMSGLIRHDAATLQAEFWAGTPISQMGAALAAVGQALPNMADIDYQTLAGAIATSTHGTGIGFGSYSSQVRGLTLVTAAGEVLECSATQHADIFSAARVGLGALGVVSRVRLQNRKAFRLREKMWMAKTEDLLAQVPTLIKQNQHWEMQVLTNSDYALSVCLNETTAAATPVAADADEGGNEYVKWIERLDKYGSDWPSARSALLNLIASTASFDERIGNSWDIFANVRNTRFNEMEYSVPAQHGPACLREVLKAIHSQHLPTWFPIEYRYIRGDDIPLSMFEGGDRCSISVHQHYTMDYHNFFAAVEPIFWKYAGRPHWGKHHSLSHAQLSALYPRMGEFTRLRASLDPSNKFLNGHLRALMGVP